MNLGTGFTASSAVANICRRCLLPNNGAEVPFFIRGVRIPQEASSLLRPGKFTSRISGYELCEAPRPASCAFGNVRALGRRDLVFNTSGFKEMRLAPPLRSVFTSSVASSHGDSKELLASASETPGRNKSSQRAIAYWYIVSSVLVFATIVVGGLTRLTESGLSIVEWNVIKGMKAPSSEEEWEQEFEKYKMFPEYEVLNRDMTLQEFKKIFYMEWLHRNLGRTVGVVFVLPGIYFALRGRLSRGMKINSLVVASLIGFQGILGWLMVKTGLSEELRSEGVPRVNAKWLAAHMGSALVIYSIQLYTAMTLLRKALREFGSASHLTSMLIFITVLSGALVAGLDAGLIYNEFPYMGGRVIPEDILGLTRNPPAGKAARAWWVNIYEDPTTVQFNHRLMGISTTVSTFLLWAYSTFLPLPPQVKRAAVALPLISTLQALLGIYTLLYQVPISTAAMHQAGSLTLFSFALWLLNSIKKFR